MTSEEQIREKLRKISALFEGATTIGERDRAGKESSRCLAEIRAAGRIPVHIARSRRCAAATIWSLIVTNGSAIRR